MVGSSQELRRGRFFWNCSRTLTLGVRKGECGTIRRLEATELRPCDLVKLHGLCLLDELEPVGPIERCDPIHLARCPGDKCSAQVLIAIVRAHTDAHPRYDEHQPFLRVTAEETPRDDATCWGVAGVTHPIATRVLTAKCPVYPAAASSGSHHSA